MRGDREEALQTLLASSVQTDMRQGQSTLSTQHREVLMQIYKYTL